MDLRPKPPQNLSEEAARWWGNLQKEYKIADQGGLFLLQSAMESFDRMRQAQKQLEAEGATIKDQTGALKQHPAILIEKSARAAMLQSFKMLNLDILPQLKVGRPGK
jgi:P27 family predicted phage terminase small subunit